MNITKREKVHINQLIEEVCNEGNYHNDEVKELQKLSVDIILTHLQAGREVIIPRLGVFYTTVSRKPTLSGDYLTIPKMRPSLTAKKILNKEGEKV